MEKFILYGTGWEALQFFYRFAEKDKIKYVLNSDKKVIFVVIRLFLLMRLILTRALIQ